MRLAHDVRRRPIGLTPLIDVVFLLLVFFLLASTFAREDMMTIRLSATQAGPAAAEAPVRIELDAEGAVHVDGAATARENMAALVLPLAEQGRSIVLVAADEVALDEVVTVLDLLARAGIEGVSLAR